MDGARLGSIWIAGSGPGLMSFKMKPCFLPTIRLLSACPRLLCAYFCLLAFRLPNLPLSSSFLSLVVLTFFT